MLTALIADFRIIFERDPAARNWLEVLFCYPGLQALMFHRVSHELYRLGLPFFPRLLSQLARFLTGKETEIKKLGGGFLQNARSWIWMPTRIEFETSTDGVNFTKAADITTDIAPEDMTEQKLDFSQNIAPTKARFVRVKAINLGKIPAWHPGAGDDAFIFVDEIFIQ